MDNNNQLFQHLVLFYNHLLINGCKIPHIPTALGPHLRCIDPIIFLSAMVTNATVIKIGTNIIKTSKLLYNIVT